MSYIMARLLEGNKPAETFVTTKLRGFEFDENAAGDDEDEEGYTEEAWVVFKKPLTQPKKK
eukprot:m.122592 g.122592  ORF g.122592 m.122592 type:complete len:61 (-) comp16569_c0_seq2:101-283(-)